MPCHSTVYNEVENVLSMFRNWKISLGASETNSTYITLPQRLDILTHGLLIVSTRKEFASYMAKRLEEKTKRHVASESMSQRHPITKRYKCLVYVTGNECIASLNHLVEEKTTITHYLNSTSSVPKIFEKDPPSSPKGWLKCQLRITNISALCLNNHLAEKLWGSNGPKIVAEMGIKNLVELEIDLLTGYGLNFF